MSSKMYDVIIVGGGIMGSATAYYLMKTDPALKVAVIERDPSYSQASTTLSMSNVRIQFSLKENILISKFAFEVLQRFEEEMAVEDNKPKIYFHREGNLFLVDRENQETTNQALDLQKELGCRVEWWSPKKIKETFPLYEPGKMLGGTYSPDDGHIDAYAMLMGYRTKARSLGTEYINNEVVEIMSTAGRATGVRLASNEHINAKYNQLRRCVGGTGG